ncbi:hypothetical protein EC973_003233 [Apophysomyces ossiformis]|uniref:Uncharacterized protein n=1 Tax=Apophysomyces ossiformis TaxID=679940 RepID=A0A8H7C0V3_9FUNG|nr:hypothetical protein EC973_003233 [Apophysomyces ossiformis]
MTGLQRTYIVGITVLAHATRALAVESSPPVVPVWAIAVAVVPLIALIAGLVYFLLRKRKQRNETSPNHVRQQASLGSFQTLVTAPRTKEEKQSNLTASMTADSAKRDTREDSVSEADDGKPTTSSLSQQPHIIQDLSLPLPVSTGSLFADKMELSSDEAIDLFQQYMNAKSAEAADPKHDRGFISIDLSGAAASLQQKAATIRGTLRQSIRRQKSVKSATPVNQLFSPAEPPPMSTPALPMEKSHPDIASQRAPSPTDEPASANSQFRPVSKTMVMPGELPAEYNFPDQHAPTGEHQSRPTGNVDIDSSEDSNNTDPVTSMDAARKAIRTASRKSKTRSMLVSDEAVQQMFNQEAELNFLPQPKGDESGHYASVRSRSPRVMEDIAASSGSVRRIVRNGTVTDGRASKSAAGARRGPGLTAQEMVGWWGDVPEVPPTPSPANLERRRFSVVSPRQTTPVMSGSATVSAKTSKALRTASPATAEGPSGRANTLGRSAQKPVGSTRGVKSLKGLFEPATTKVSPDGLSQKTQALFPEKSGNKWTNQEKKYGEDISDTGSDQDMASTKYAVSEDEMEEMIEKHSPSNTEKKGDVNAIRRMLQATWDNNMKESESMASLASADAGNSSSRAPFPRHTSAVGGSNRQELTLPAPTASFSSSTMQTVVPLEDTNKLRSKPSTSSFFSRQQSSEGHSRKSSGGHSSNTVVQIGSQTWTGRAQKVRPNLSQVEVMDAAEEMPPLTKTGTIGRAGRDHKAFLTAARSSRRPSAPRAGLPWMEQTGPNLRDTDRQDDMPASATDLEDLRSERSSWATIRPA